VREKVHARGAGAADRTRNTGHGRRESRSVKAVTLHTPGIAFPHAQQAVRITRTRTTSTKTSRETVYLTVPLPTGDALPADLRDPDDQRGGTSPAS
jgi:hypothetical protein